MKADGDRQHADDDADQSLQLELPGGGGRRRHGNLDHMFEGHARIGDEVDRVRFAQNPREGQVDPCGRGARDVAWRILGELPVGAVDLDLGDLHRLGAAGPHKQMKAGRVDHGALESQFLDGGRAIVKIPAAD